MQRFLNNPRLLLAVTAIITLGIVGLSVFSDKLPSLEKFSNLTADTPIPYVTIAPGEKPLIAAVSERKDVLVNILNKEALASILNEIGVFNKVYNQELQKDNLPLKKIIIVLTSGKQLKEYKDAAGNVAFSYNFEFLKDYAIIYINLPADVISDSSAGQMFGASVIYIASKLEESGKPVNISQAEFDNYYRSAGGLFQIEQRSFTNSTLPPEIQTLLSPTPTPTPTR